MTTTGSDTANTCLLQASPCATLGHAVEQANDGDTIALDTAIYTASGLLIDKRLALAGVNVVIH